MEDKNKFEKKKIFISQNASKVELVKSLLDANNIYSFIENEWQTRGGEFYSSPLGGVILTVSSEDYERAQEVLKTYINEDINKASEGKLPVYPIDNEQTIEERKNIGKFPWFSREITKWHYLISAIIFAAGIVYSLISYLRHYR